MTPTLLQFSVLTPHVCWFMCNPTHVGSGVHEKGTVYHFHKYKNEKLVHHFATADMVILAHENLPF